MESSNSEKYLGDQIHHSGTVTATILSRKAKGYGRVNEILALLNEAPLGSWKIKAGIILRQAMLINGTLFNSEAWHGISDKEVSSLEKVDEALLKGLLS